MMQNVKAGDRIGLANGESYTVARVVVVPGALFPYAVYDNPHHVPMDVYREDGTSGDGDEYAVVSVRPGGMNNVHPAPAEAARFNTGKTPYGNLPLDLLDGAARVMAKGEKKYSRANYRKGYDDLMGPLHSLLRHVAALQPAIEQELYDKDGPLFDAETGESHVHHAVTSALILIQAMRKKGIDV